MDFLAVGCLDGNIYVINLNDYGIRGIKAHRFGIKSIQISDDGKFIVSGGIDRQIKIWNSGDFNLISSPFTCSDTITCIAISSSGNGITAGCADGTIYIYNSRHPKILFERKVSNSEIARLCFIDGEIKIAVACDKIFEFDSNTSILLELVSEPEYPAFLASFSKDAQRIVYVKTAHSIFGTGSNTIKIHDSSANISFAMFQGDSGARGMDLACGGDLLYVNSPEPRLLNYYLTSQYGWLETKIKQSRFLAISADGKKAAIIDRYGILSITEIDSKATLITSYTATGLIQEMMFDHEAGRILLTSDDSRLSIIEVVTGKPICNISDKTIKMTYKDEKSFIFKDRVVLIRSLGVFLVDITTGSITEVNSIRLGQNDATVSDDGKLLALAVLNFILVYDIPSAKLKYRLVGHDFTVRSIAFSPDSQSLISGSDDKTVKIWSMSTGKIKLNNLYGIDEISKVSFFKDGRHYIFGDRNGKLARVNAADGVVEKFYIGHTSEIASILFINNGEFFVSVSRDGVKKIWQIQTNTSISYLDSSSSWLVYTDDGYWDGSPSCGKLVAMVRGMEVWNIDQFAVRNNRPDIILERMGSADSARIAQYRALYQKRLRRLGLTEESLARDYHVPWAKVVSQKQDGKFVNLALSFEDTNRSLKRYNIYVNDVPLYGSYGHPLSGNRAEINARVELTSGDNKIEVSCMNDGGAESFRVPLYANYEGKEKGNLYFLAFGVSKYKNTLDGKSINLGYAAKDARDLEAKFRRMEGREYGKVYSRVYLDADVTLENIKQAKEFLKNAAVDDTFVLFIAGHGVYVGDTYYYLMHDTDLTNIAATSADFEHVEDLLQGITPRKKLFLMDTCESGEREQGAGQVAMLIGARGLKARSLAAARGLKLESKPVPSFLLDQKDRYIYNDLVRRSGAVVFSSAKGVEYSLESSELQNGLFTAEIIDGLSGKADANKDGRVDIAELTEFVSKAVPELAQRFDPAASQHPTVDRDNIYIKFGFPIVK
jgi:WD40 repeat protein